LTESALTGLCVEAKTHLLRQRVGVQIVADAVYSSGALGLPEMLSARLSMAKGSTSRTVHLRRGAPARTGRCRRDHPCREGNRRSRSGRTCWDNLLASATSKVVCAVTFASSARRRAVSIDGGWKSKPVMRAWGKLWASTTTEAP